MWYPGSEPWAYTRKMATWVMAKMDNNIIDNIMEENHAIEWVPSLATYKMEKLNLDMY